MGERRIVRQYHQMSPPAVVELANGRRIEVYADQGQVHLVVRVPSGASSRTVAYTMTTTPDAARAIAAAIVVQTGGAS